MRAPLLIASLEHPGRRIGETEGLETPFRRRTTRPRSASATAPRRATTFVESGAFHRLGTPARRGLLLAHGPAPSHAARHFRGWGIAPEGRAFVFRRDGASLW